MQGAGNRGDGAWVTGVFSDGTGRLFRTWIAVTLITTLAIFLALGRTEPEKRTHERIGDQSDGPVGFERNLTKQVTHSGLPVSS